MRFRSAMVLTALLSSPLVAQQQAGTPAAPMPAALKSFTSKFFFTGALNGASISLDQSSNSENGGGASLGFGYGFNPKFALYMEGTGTSMSSETGDYGMGHFDIGLRYHFANVAHTWIPFLDAAFSGRAVAQNDVTICDASNNCSTDDLSMSGGGFTFGGGVMYYASPKVAISANLKWTTGDFTDVTFGNVTVTGLKQGATSTRFGLGMVWFPAAK